MVVNSSINTRKDTKNKKQNHDNLSNYFIALSHNTYCKKNQIDWTHHTIGIEPYIWFLNTFNGGCVEIDIMGNNDGNVFVCHGKYPGAGSLRPIRLDDILQAIIDWSTSRKKHFPIIISLDIKNTHPRVLKTIDTYFKLCFTKHPTILYPPEGLSYNPYIDNLSMKHTMNKILLKINTPVSFRRNMFLFNRIALPKHKMLMSGTNHSVIPSIIIQYIRVYPSFLNIFSQNFNPLPFWEQGTNMVALNFQRNDKYTFAYEKTFKNNAYIHKSNIKSIQKKFTAYVNLFDRQKLPSFKSFT